MAQLAAYPNFRFIEQEHLADLAGAAGGLGRLEATARAAPGGPARRALLDRAPAYLCPGEPGRLPERAGAVPALAGRAPGLCQQLEDVYGANAQLPFSEDHSVDHPVSLYAATKKANELMAHTYSHLYELPTSGLRFFTVYGPWGRPDMAPFKFVKAISAGRAETIYDVWPRPDGARLHLCGRHRRIDVRVLDSRPRPMRIRQPAVPRSSTGIAPYRVFNIGNSDPVQLMDFVSTIEQAVGREADKRMLPAQPGDVEATYADTSALRNWVGFQPATPLKDGVARFVDWYRSYYGQ